MHRLTEHADDRDTLFSDLPGGKPDSREPLTQFDATQPVTHRRDRSYGNVDDPALTAFVTALWDELHSRRAEPVPLCPHCGGGNTRLHNLPNRHHALPIFVCRSCLRTYSRLTGSPLARLRFAQKMPRFIEMLSQPIPLEEASRRLDVDYSAVSNS
jgi:transposase-like protein